MLPRVELAFAPNRYAALRQAAVALRRAGRGQIDRPVPPRDGIAVRIVFALLPILLLAACGGDGIAPPPAAVSKPEPRVPHHAPLRETGLSGVIGADAEALIRQFGPPRLDIHDGDARKLQWSGAACIMDAYLYPGDHGGRPQATFIDTRRGDGRDVDHAACIAALKKN